MPYNMLTQDQINAETNWDAAVVKQEKKGGGCRMNNPSKSIASFSSNLPRDVQARPVIEFSVHNPQNKYYNEKRPDVTLRIPDAFFEYLQLRQDDAKAVVLAQSAQLFGRELKMESVEAMLSSPLKVSAYGNSLRAKLRIDDCKIAHENGQPCDVKDLLQNTPCTVALKLSSIWANSNQWGLQFEIKKIMIHERIAVDLDFYDGESNTDDEDDSEPEQQRGKRKAPANQRISKKSKGLLN